MCNKDIFFFRKILKANHLNIKYLSELKVDLISCIRFFRHGSITHICGYSFKPAPNLTGKPNLTRFGFRFGFSSITKYGNKLGNGDTCICPVYFILYIIVLF